MFSHFQLENLWCISRYGSERSSKTTKTHFIKHRTTTFQTKKYGQKWEKDINKDKVEKDRYRGRLEWDLPSLWNSQARKKERKELFGERHFKFKF